MDPASVGLRAIHREIGPFEQGRRIRVAGIEHGDADARAKENLVSADDVAGLDGRDDRLGERRGRRPNINRRVNNRELVPAEPRAKVARPGDHVRQAGRDGLQEFVADRVSEGVVDILEAIEIDEQIGRAESPNSSANCRAAFSLTSKANRLARPVNTS